MVDNDKGWSGWGNENLLKMGIRELFCIQWLHICMNLPKTYWTKYLKRVDFIVCKLYLKKAVWKIDVKTVKRIYYRGQDGEAISRLIFVNNLWQLTSEVAVNTQGWSWLAGLTLLQENPLAASIFAQQLIPSRASQSCLKDYWQPPDPRDLSSRNPEAPLRNYE